MRARGSLMLLGVATVSVGTIVGTVGLAVEAGVPTPALSVASRLPRSLFEKEVSPARFAPVALSIAEEVPLIIEPSPSPSETGRGPRSTSSASGPASGGIGGSPSPSPAPSPLPSMKPSPSPSPSAAAKPAMGLDLSGKARGQGQKQSIAYEATLTNTGSVALSSVDFSSHIPADTEWRTAQQCSFTGYPVTISYASSGRTETVCVRGSSVIVGSDDPSRHPVTARLSESIPPGSTAKIQWLVDYVGPGDQDVFNHAHAAVAGTVADSGQAVTSMR